MAGPRALVLPLLVILLCFCLECSAQSAGKKKKPCKYNGNKYEPGEVIAVLEENCAELKCSKKGKKAKLTHIENCTYGRQECSMNIIASHGMKVNWQTPNFDGITHYPAGDYCCFLNITIPVINYNVFMVNVKMIGQAGIYETNRCAQDSLEYTNTTGHTDRLCGDLTRKLWREWGNYILYNTPRHFNFKFCTTAQDNDKTDIGFKMEITGIDYADYKTEYNVECSMNIIASDGMKVNWQTPNYDGVTHYPAATPTPFGLRYYCCILNITIPDTYNMFMVDMEMIGQAGVYKTNLCEDSLKYTNSTGHTDRYCGNLTSQSWYEIASYNGPRHFNMEFFTRAQDNNETDIGFKMEIRGRDMRP